ncbi:MAG: hypothetical protein NT157_05390 [Candidatus Micrarchaeota archaeon]|nr:hypothetical protein [Candidatus Micrarchaeota archaeon]
MIGMKTDFVLAFVLMLLLASEFAFAATASDAALQVTGYSVVPTKVYPGTKGYVQLTIENTGSGTASGIKLDYSDSYAHKIISTYPSDIAAGSNSQVSIPFTIPQDFNSGMMLYTISAYYLATPEGGSSKSTTFSVPVVISQNEILQVDTLSIGKASLSPGEKVSVDLEIRNTGGIVNDLTISCPLNSSFSIEGSTRKYVGSIPSDSAKNVTIELVSSSLASVGQYLIPLTFSYMDALQNQTTPPLYVGAVNVLDPSSHFRLSLDPMSTAEIGAAVDFKLAIENIGTSETSAIVDVSSTSVFTPLGASKIYFGSIEPGKTAYETVSLGIDASASSGYYELPVNVTLGTGKTFTHEVGIRVEATPEIKITGEVSTSTTGSEIVIQVSNVGNTAIRSVYAVVDYGGSKTEKFIGTMAIDDYSTITVSASSSGTANMSGTMPQPGASSGASVPQQNGSRQSNTTQQVNRTQQATGKAKVTVTFKDEQNQPHTVIQEVSINSAGAGQTSFASRTTAKSSGIIFGLDAIQLGAIVLVAAGGGYYLYRRRKRKLDLDIDK